MNTYTELPVLQRQIDEASEAAQSVLTAPPTMEDIIRLAEAVLAICGALQNVKQHLLRS
jgi:hypothetical protein